MRTLITGVTGFVGGHLAEALLSASAGEIHGLSRSGAFPPEWQHLNDQVTLHAVDLTDAAAVEALIRSVRPDRIVHLAGFADAGRSFREPGAAWAGNLTATRTLFDAVTHWGGSPRIVVASSVQVYGVADPPDVPVAEDAPLKPVSPYAASKASADLLAFQASCHPGLDVVRVRPCNQIGPRQASRYVVATFARQLARIERGLAPPVLECGDLSSRRDFLDVRDVVRAYLLLLEKGRKGEAYNVGGGTLLPVEEVVKRLTALARVPVEVRVEASRLRPVDAAACLDAGKLRRETGWSPQFMLDQTLRDVLEYWRGVE
jgi:GDP-4-dehydro-6-deoxy-D-mannose reductase